MADMESNWSRWDTISEFDWWQTRKSNSGKEREVNIEDALLTIVNEIIRIKNITDPLRNIEEDEPLMEIAREMLEQLRQGERSDF
jgi:hypothetical protein